MLLFNKYEGDRGKSLSPLYFLHKRLREDKRLDFISLLGDNKYILIIVAIALVALFIISLVKKIIKLAIVIAIAFFLNAYAIGFISKFNDEFGFKYKDGIVYIDNKYNSGISFSANEIKSITVDKSKSNDKELTVVVNLKNNSTVTFNIGSQYEQMARDIINKAK